MIEAKKDFLFGLKVLLRVAISSGCPLVGEAYDLTAHDHRRHVETINDIATPNQWPPAAGRLSLR